MFALLFQVQVIQQPLQNPTYLQQLYNTQGQLLMPSNIQLHPGINPQQIQVSIFFAWILFNRMFYTTYFCFRS